MGATDLAAHPGEKITEGLDGLRNRLKEYFQMGARFAKWRAVITVGSGIPSSGCIEANAQALARYAALCQEEGLVPIVEPALEIWRGEEANVVAAQQALLHRLRCNHTEHSHLRCPPPRGGDHRTMERVIRAGWKRLNHTMIIGTGAFFSYLFDHTTSSSTA